MAIIALQGLRGGVGTTSITAALAWGLQQLGESVLVIDVTPANLLRMHFNTDFTHTNGWARAEFDGTAWQDAALRYTDLLDFLPFGQISADEHAQFFTNIHRWTQWAQNISPPLPMALLTLLFLTLTATRVYISNRCRRELSC